MRRGSLTVRSRPDLSPLASKFTSLQESLQQRVNGTPLSRLHDVPPHFGTKYAEELLEREELAAVKSIIDTVKQIPKPRLDVSPAIHLRDQVMSSPLVTSTQDLISRAHQTFTSTSQGIIDGFHSEVQALTGDAGALQPHYGSRAAGRLTDAAQQWFNSQLPAIEAADGSALASLRESLQQLSLSAQGSLEGLQTSVQQGSQGLQSSGQGIHWTAPIWPNTGVGLQRVQELVQGGQLAAAAKAATAGLQEAALHAQQNGIGGYSLQTLGLLALGMSMSIAVSAPTKAYQPMDVVAPDSPLPKDYDIDAVAAHYERRPLTTLRRGTAVLAAAMQFGIGYLLDSATGQGRKRAARRARSLRTAIERLGPAYVKVAQAISTRVDILSPEYLLEIERLQDQVPPFPTAVAQVVMQNAFNGPTSSVFQSLSPEPVASASLGQVYKGRLRPELGGDEVAVKVQRPAMLESIALDLYLMRSFAIFAQRFPNVRTDWVGLIDEWACRFFEETDYEREAANALAFQAQMADIDGIVVPDVFLQYTSREVLMTSWVQGEKLSQSNAGDVRELCTTLLNCYLIQLLETGFLHADPHTGNLLRTPEGKICILDFGMMTQVTPDQSIALVEYIAHLSVEDWDMIPYDLAQLGFLPPGVDPVKSGLIGPLSSILTQLVRGGGARGFNIDQVTAELDELAVRFPFQIPSYFALILRAFSVIEGIALRVDPSYAIVKECFPYLSRRLLTDNHPRTRAALHQLLYGGKTRLDVARLQRLTSGFGAFTVAGIAGQSEPVAVPAQGHLIDENVKEAIRLIFTREESYIQEVVVDEAVAALDAVGRQAVSTVVGQLLGSVPAMATLSTVSALGPFRSVVFPLPTPVDFLSWLQPIVKVTPEDQEALTMVRAISSLLPPSSSSTLSPASPASGQLAAELYPLLVEVLPGLSRTGELLVRGLLSRVVLRAADELDPRRKTLAAALATSTAGSSRVRPTTT
ncbi:hypothetical protein WJX84_009124 [Apatococcus fuscideae]|uniref:ABC1 atypical kinase-like domain-containing protein n=1 Tax=Apatococcus fuscideae TaxID=2026836 RepID=A0AAW1TB12_9CHLO